MLGGIMNATLKNQQFTTLSELATTFGVERAVMATWLAEIGLRSGSGSPTRKALSSGFCKVLNAGGGGALVLWQRQQVIAVLRAAGYSTANEEKAKDALSRMITTVRPAMGWSEIQEVLIAAMAKEHGVETKLI
jgi:hypothetical protein